MASIQECLADEVDWAVEAESRAAPWFGRRNGRDGATSFFAALGESIEVSAFRPHSFAGRRERCPLPGGLDVPLEVTGREASMTMRHHWRFADGKVAYFRGSEDIEQTASLFD